MNATSQVDCVDTDVFCGLEYRILQMRVGFFSLREKGGQSVYNFN